MRKNDAWPRCLTGKHYFIKKFRDREQVSRSFSYKQFTTMKTFFLVAAQYFAKQK